MADLNVAYDLMSEILPVQYKNQPKKQQHINQPQNVTARTKPTPTPPPQPQRQAPVNNNPSSFEDRIVKITGKAIPAPVNKAIEFANTPVPELLGKVTNFKIGTSNKSESFAEHNYGKKKNKMTKLIFIIVFALAFHLFIETCIQYVVKENGLNEMFIMFMYVVIVATILWLIATSNNSPSS